MKVQEEAKKEEFLTPEEVSKYLRLSTPQVNRMLRTNCIPCMAVPVGKSRKIYRVIRKDFEEWCARNVRKAS